MTGFAFAQGAIIRAGGESHLRDVAREVVDRGRSESYFLESFEDDRFVGVRLILGAGADRIVLTAARASASSAVRADQRADARRDREALAAELRRLVEVVAFDRLDPLEQRAMDGDR